MSSYNVGSILVDLNVDLGNIKQAANQSSRVFETALGVGMSNAASGFFTGFGVSGSKVSAGLGMSMKTSLIGASAAFGIAMGAVILDTNKKMMNLRNSIGQGLVSSVGKSIVEGINQAASENMAASVTDVILRNNDANSSSGDQSVDTANRFKLFNKELTSVSSALSYSRVEIAGLIESLARVGFTTKELYGGEGQESVTSQFATLGKALGLAGSQFDDLIKITEILSSSFGSDMNEVSATVLTLANSTAHSIESIRFGLSNFADTAVAMGYEMNSAMDLFSRLIKTTSPREAGTATANLLKVGETLDTSAYLSDIAPLQMASGNGSFLDKYLKEDAIADEILKVFDATELAIQNGSSDFSRGMTKEGAKLRYNSLSEFQQNNVKLNETARVTGVDRGALALLLKNRETQEKEGGETFADKQKKVLENGSTRGLEAFRVANQSGIGGMIDLIQSATENVKANMVTELIPGFATLGQIILETTEQVGMAEGIFSETLGKLSESLLADYGGEDVSKRTELVNRLSDGFINLIQTAGTEIYQLANNALDILEDPAKLKEVFKEVQGMATQAVESFNTMTEFMLLFNNSAKATTDTINTFVSWLTYLGDAFSFTFNSIKDSFASFIDSIQKMPILGGMLERGKEIDEKAKDKGLDKSKFITGNPVIDLFVQKGLSTSFGDLKDTTDKAIQKDKDKRRNKRLEEDNTPQSEASKFAENAYANKRIEKAKELKAKVNNNNEATPVSSAEIQDARTKIAEQRTNIEKELLSISKERRDIENEISLSMFSSNKLLQESMGNIFDIISGLEDYKVDSEQKILDIKETYGEPIKELEGTLASLNGKNTDENPEITANIAKAKLELDGLKEDQNQAIQNQTTALESQGRLATIELGEVLKDSISQLSEAITSNLNSFVDIGSDTSGFSGEITNLVNSFSELLDAANNQLVVSKELNNMLGSSSEAQLQSINQTKVLIETLSKNQIKEQFQELATKVEDYGLGLINDVQKSAFTALGNVQLGDGQVVKDLSNAVLAFKESSVSSNTEQVKLTREIGRLNSAIEIQQSLLGGLNTGTKEFNQANTNIQSMEAQKLATQAKLTLGSQINNSKEDVSNISLLSGFTKTLSGVNSEAESLIGSLSGIDNSISEVFSGIKKDLDAVSNLSKVAQDVEKFANFADFDKIKETLFARISNNKAIVDNDNSSLNDVRMAESSIKSANDTLQAMNMLRTNTELFSKFVESLQSKAQRLSEIKVEQFVNQFNDSTEQFKQMVSDLRVEVNNSLGEQMTTQIEDKNYNSYRKDAEVKAIELDTFTSEINNALQINQDTFAKQIRDANLEIEKFELSLGSSINEKGNPLSNSEKEAQKAQLTNLYANKNLLVNQKEAKETQLKNDLAVQEQLVESYITLVGRTTKELTGIFASSFDSLFDVFTNSNGAGIGQNITDMLNNAINQAGRVGFELLFGGVRDYFTDMFLPEDVKLREAELKDFNSSEISDTNLTTRIDGTNEATQILLESLTREVTDSTANLTGSFTEGITQLRDKVEDIANLVSETSITERDIMSEVASNTLRTADSIEKFLNAYGTGDTQDTDQLSTQKVNPPTTPEKPTPVVNTAIQERIIPQSTQKVTTDGNGTKHYYYDGRYHLTPKEESKANFLSIDPFNKQGTEVASTSLKGLGLPSETILGGNTDAVQNNTLALDRFSQSIVADAGLVTDNSSSSDKVNYASYGQPEEQEKSTDEIALAKKQKIQGIGTGIGAGIGFAQQTGILSKPQSAFGSALSLGSQAAISSGNPYVMGAGAVGMLLSSLFGGEQKPRRYNSGTSLVPGSGTTDTVPAMLTPGESVLTVKATQSLGNDTINRLNSGSLNSMNSMGYFNKGVASIKKANSLGISNNSRMSTIPGVAKDFAEFSNKSNDAQSIEEFTSRTTTENKEDSKLSFSIETRNIGGVEYTTVDQVSRMMEATVAKAQNNVFKSLRGSTRTRKQLGL